MCAVCCRPSAAMLRVNVRRASPSKLSSKAHPNLLGPPSLHCCLCSACASSFDLLRHLRVAGSRPLCRLTSPHLTHLTSGQTRSTARPPPHRIALLATQAQVSLLRTARTHRTHTTRWHAPSARRNVIAAPPSGPRPTAAVQYACACLSGAGYASARWHRRDEIGGEPFRGPLRSSASGEPAFLLHCVERTRRITGNAGCSRWIEVIKS